MPKKGDDATTRSYSFDGLGRAWLNLKITEYLEKFPSVEGKNNLSGYKISEKDAQKVAILTFVKERLGMIEPGSEEALKAEIKKYPLYDQALFQSKVGVLVQEALDLFKKEKESPRPPTVAASPLSTKGVIQSPSQSLPSEENAPGSPKSP